MVRKVGTAKGEAITGTSGPDELIGLGGHDRIYANAGDDWLYGNEGDDGLWGQAGHDVIYAGAGVDNLVGDSGNDWLYGEQGNDWLTGGTGNDVLLGGVGNDTIRGDAGHDHLEDHFGNNNLNGGDGDDWLIFGSPGLATNASNVFNGGAGYDTLMLNNTGVTITTPNGNAQATVRVAFNDPSGPSFGYVDAPTTTFVKSGTFSNIENFAITQDSSLIFSGGNTNVTANGGMYRDVFASGSGAETFIGGAAGDEFYMDSLGGGGDYDTLIGFNPAEDVIVSSNWWNSDGDPTSLIRNVTEANDHTYVTTTDAAGNLLHTIEIDTVGVPESVFRNGLNYYSDIV